MAITAVPNTHNRTWIRCFFQQFGGSPVVVVLVTRPSPTLGARLGQLTKGVVVHYGESGNPDANVCGGVRMGLTALVFSGVGETGRFGHAAIHKP